MILEFKRRCTDKITGEKYEAGQQKEFDDARAKAILAKKDGLYAKEVKAKKQKEKTSKEKADDGTDRQ